MQRLLPGLALIILSAGLVNAQTAAAPTTSYELHAQKEHHSANLPTTLMRLLPDQTLLILIPQDDGKWFLKRLSAWDTAKPKEETLTFMEEQPQEGVSGFEELKIDPSGIYALIRLKSYTGNHWTKSDNQSAVIVLVDLRSFTLVSQMHTIDPLLAASNWSFVDKGLLVASAKISRSTDPVQPAHAGSPQTITETYRAAAITLPDWKLSNPCEYEALLDLRTHHVSKSSEGCSALVALARVQGPLNLPGGKSESTPYAKLAGPMCKFGGQSPDEDFAFYGCQAGHSYADGMIATINRRDVTVLSVPDGKTILTIQLPHNQNPYPVTLANAQGLTWLVVLRDGINFQAYRLPESRK